MFYVYIFRSIPKSSNKLKLAVAIEGQIRPTKKPDLDKLVQGIKDGMSKVVRHDNAQTLIWKFASSIQTIQVLG
ncbi:RusA family crossover junction endodeoxyribonuclease [Psychrobacillus soli]|uniref:RusA family crossover junction endodeoxyribonuclease n=1 Tax=Psychrobacillus soli TaxID=1543965 RepID=UPI003CCC7EC7